MDRGDWQATVHGISRDGYNLVTKPTTRVYRKGRKHTHKNVKLYGKITRCEGKWCGKQEEETTCHKGQGGPSGVRMSRIRISFGCFLVH